MPTSLGLGLGLAFAAGTGFPVGGASFHADFVNNRVYGASDIATAFPVTRSGTAYADDSANLWAPVSADTLRRTDKGLRIEESRTNSIRNNSMQGAATGAIGSGGALPTNWVFVSTGGLARTVIGTGTDSGTDYIDIRFSGTTSGTALNIAFEGGVQTAAVQNQTWSMACHTSIAGGGTTNITTIRYVLIENNSGGSVLSSSVLVFTPTTAALSSQRRSLSYTLPSATAAFVYPRLDLVFSNGAAIDITLRFAWPQMELGAGPTSPIRTTSATVARSADAVTLASATSYLSLTQGSIFIEWDEVQGPVGTARYLFAFRVDANNTVYARIGTDNKVHFIVVAGGVTSCDLASTNAVEAGTRYKAAFRWGVNDFAAQYTSSLGSPSNDTSGSVPTGSPVFGLGQDGASSGYANNNIRQFACFLTGQSDATLAVLVA